MKKAFLFTIVALFAASSAWAGFGLPKVSGTGSGHVDSALNKGIDKGKNMAVAQVINDKLKKYNCMFKKDDAMQARDVSCDLNKIASELSMWKNGLESTIVNKVRVNVMAGHKKSDSMAMDRARNVCNKISEKVSWWDCVESTGKGSNDVMVSVSVN